MKKQFWRRLAGWGFALIVALALVTGYVGLYRYVHAHPAPDRYSDRVIDMVYFDLQLFVMGSDPLQGNVHVLPWELNVARIVAPAATIWALVGTTLVIFSDSLAGYFRRRRKGHAVVVGDTLIAAAVRADLKASGQTVERDPLGTTRSLKQAGIAGAAALYACADESADGAANVAVAIAAKGTPRSGRALKIYAHVSDPMLRVGLRARRLGLPADSSFHIDFFNVEELAAHNLMRGEPVAEASHVLVAGLSTFGQAVLVELARRRALSPAGPLDVTVVDEGAADEGSGEAAERAAKILASLVARCPALETACTVRVLAGVPANRRIDGLPRPDRAYICYDDENHALKIAMSAAWAWHVEPDALVVRLNRLAHHSAAFSSQAEAAAQEKQWKLLDDLSGRLRLVGVTDLGCDLVSIHEDLVGLIARTIHDNYYTTQTNRGATGPALVPWEQLAADKKAANLHQAADIGNKLSLIRATVAPLTDEAEPFAFTEAEIDQLAREEHDRWMRERASQGWTLGPRDDAKKTHPSMKAYDLLSKDEQAKDVDAVIGLPGVLGDVGLRIVRLEAGADR